MNVKQSDIYAVLSHRCKTNPHRFKLEVGKHGLVNVCRHCGFKKIKGHAIIKK